MIGLIGLFVTPLVMSLPTGLMTAELSTAFPTSGMKSCACSFTLDRIYSGI